MKLDPLKQYAKLREQLLREKMELESRLNEINQVLGSEPSSAGPGSNPVASASGPRSRGGRRGGNSISMREAVIQALAKGPLGRQELVKAVQDTGYVFTTRNPLNSIGAILYGKNTPIKKKDGKFYVEGRAAVATSGEQNGNGRTHKKRTMSPEARARISAAQKARWAKQKR